MVVVVVVAAVEATIVVEIHGMTTKRAHQRVGIVWKSQKLLLLLPFWMIGRHVVVVVVVVVVDAVIGSTDTTIFWYILEMM